MGLKWNRYNYKGIAGEYANIGRKRAKAIAEANGVRVPRPGYFVPVNFEGWRHELTNQGGKLTLERRDRIDANGATSTDRLLATMRREAPGFGR